MSRSADAFLTLVRKDVIHFPKGRVSESLLMSCWYSFNFSEYEDLGVRGVSLPVSVAPSRGCDSVPMQGQESSVFF